MKITCQPYRCSHMELYFNFFFNFYNILYKLKHSFNIVSTYVYNDEVHSDDHHHIIVTVVHICKWQDAIYTLHGFRISRTLHPYLPAVILRSISGPQLAGQHSTSHAYQLYQRVNDIAGWTDGFEPHRKRNSLLITHTPD